MGLKTDSDRMATHQEPVVHSSSGSQQWKQKTARAVRLLGTRGAAIAFWAIVLLHVTPVVPSVTRVLTDRWDDPAGDVLIVPGADQLGDGTLGTGSYWRTLYAVRAWRAGNY